MGIKASASVTVAQVTDGTDGNGIKSTVVEYQAGASGTTAPTGSWSTSIPATTASAPYLWTKVTYTYTDGSAPKVVYSVGSTPEGVVVGGRNLLKKSDIKSFNTSFLNVNGYEITQMTGKGSGLIFDSSLFDIGQTYVLSLKFQKLEGTLTSIAGHCAGFKTNKILINDNIPNGNPTSWELTHTIEDSSDIQNIKVCLTYNGNAGDNNLYVQPQRNVYHSSNDIKIKYWDIKLEKGNKATDWTPAPEDVNSSIDTAKQNAINTAASDATSKANQAKMDAINTAAADATNKVNAIEVGGRNYISYGKGDVKKGFFAKFSKVENGYGEHTLTSKKNYAALSLNDGFILGCRDYEVGKQVVFSYDIMYTEWNIEEGASLIDWNMGQRYTTQTISGGDKTGTWRTVTYHGLPRVGTSGCELNTWFHVSKKITIPEQAAEGIGTQECLHLYNSSDTASIAITFRIKNVKIEYGNKETDWTPAPEDVEEGIDNAQTSADEANATLLDWCYNNNKVYINGSKIYAGTVSATQIAAKAVTADKLSVSTLSAICADLGSVTAGSINIGNGKFVVDSSGNLTATSASITGNIIASTLTATNTGSLGCWIFNEKCMMNAFKSGVADTGRTGVSIGVDTSTGDISPGSGLCFWAGASYTSTPPNGFATNLSAAPFRVYANGALVATNATITGNITATSVKLADEIQIKGNSYVASGYTDYFPLINHANGNINFAVLFNTMTTTSIVCPRIYTTDKSSGWITVLQGYAGLNVMDAGASNGFNGLARVKCTNGAWAIGALNGDSFNTFVLAYANETRLNSGENGYDASFWFYPNGKLNISNTVTISAGDLVVSNGWIYLANGMRLRTYNSSGTGANLIHWGTDNRIYIGEITTKATKIRICQTCSNIGVLNSSGNWVTITTGVSDIREKNSIEDLRKSKEIIMGLKPKRFKFNDPEDDRYHLGFIAQDVRKTLDATIGDCAILEYNNTDPDELRPVNRDDESTFTYSMRYNEIIPAHVGLTQEHEYRIESMDNKIENLQTLLMEALDKIAAQEKLIEQLQTS